MYLQAILSGPIEAGLVVHLAPGARYPGIYFCEVGSLG